MPTSVDVGFSGYWYNTSQSGHGFSFEVLPGNVFLVNWLTFNSQGQQAWLIGLGTISNGTASAALVQPTGGLFPPYFNPASITRVNWGTLNVAFSDCGHANASWTTNVGGFGTGSGNLDLVHLTQPVASAGCR
jgi:hypothetical protein